MKSSPDKAKGKLFRDLHRATKDKRVLEAMAKVPREDFIPEETRHLAYEDIALPIGEGQTISQPFMVAVMTSALQLMGYEKVLELGTGSGYQAAVISHLLHQGSLLSVEKLSVLARSAEARLRTLGCSNVTVRLSKPELGFREEAPFDAILVTAASPGLPLPLVEQMAPGGRLVIPIGTLEEQQLVRVIKTDEGNSIKALGSCRFVPLIGRDAWSEHVRQL